MDHEPSSGDFLARRPSPLRPGRVGLATDELDSTTENNLRPLAA